MDLETLEGARQVRRIIAVGGGKGGAGRSLIAANVGIFLATLGKRVALFDADLGGANLHTFLGVARPRVTVGDLFADRPDRRLERLADAVVETAVPGAGLISGEGDPSWIASLRPDQKLRLLKEVQRLDVDYLVIDLGAGSGPGALDFFLLADVGLLVVVPEPTAVENAFRFLKSVFIRRLRRNGLERALDLAPEGDRGFEGGLPAPWDLYVSARQQDADLGAQVLGELVAFRPRVVVNQVRARADEELATTLAQAARRRLGVAVDALGYVESDDAVWLAVRKRRPLLVEHPESVAARGIERLTRRILSLETGEPPSAPYKPLEEQTHYEVLDVAPTAPEEEIRRAYRRARETYGADSLVLSGLYSDRRLDALHDRFDQAFETLMDASRRRAYDQTIFPEGAPTPSPDRKGTPPAGVPVAAPAVPLAVDAAAAPPTPAPAAPPPPEPEVGPDTPWSGPLFRQVREARGIDLQTISQRTKIGVGHLRALEEERFDLLPAAVYVRGFLQEYAKVLRIDIGKGLAAYLDRVRAAKAQTEDRG